MSEWYDSQNKPNGDFRKLLQERLNKVNPRQKDKPDELRRYDEKLRNATFYYNRAEGYSSKGKHATAKKFYNKSESLCEAGELDAVIEQQAQFGRRVTQKHK